MKSSNIRYLPAVDHLRGYAALLVVLYHGLQLLRHEMATPGVPFSHANWLHSDNWLFPMILEGHTSVGFFMVLSGFIFTFGTLDRGVAYWRFMGNRVLRIYPLFGFTIAVAACAAQSGFSFMALLQTLFFQYNLPGGFQGGDILGVAWAVAVEFQFYLIFPFIIRFTRTYGIRYIFGLLLLIWIYRLLATIGTTPMKMLSYLTVVGRMDHFLIGMLIGALYLRRPSWVHRLRFALPATAFIIFAIIRWFHTSGGYPGVSPTIWFVWPTVEAVGWALFSLSYMAAVDWLPKLVSRVCAYVGELSFSIYLTHFIVIRFMCQQRWFVKFSADLTLSAMLNTLLFVVPTTLALSSLTYFLIERPFLKMRKAYLGNEAKQVKEAPAAT
jgi:peptidoglycan/LPS O-acetylase OafA/YrhL